MVFFSHPLKLSLLSLFLLKRDTKARIEEASGLSLRKENSVPRVSIPSLLYISTLVDKDISWPFS